MSITFTIAIEKPDVIDSACSADHRACNADCEDFAYYHHCDCVEAAIAECPFCGVSVNMSNSNAAMVFERLGIEFDYCGTIDAQDLLGRALTMNIGRDDSGVAVSEDRAPGRATIIDMGLAPGYYDARQSALVTLANRAIEWGYTISYS